jgi:hypothetical protein
MIRAENGVMSLCLQLRELLNVFEGQNSDLIAFISKGGNEFPQNLKLFSLV